MAGAEQPAGAASAPAATATPAHLAHPDAAPLVTDHPNQVWPADFKGQFKTGDGRYCYPLTITDHFTRAVLACRGLSSITTSAVQPVFRALLRAVGLPEAIRTDNGTPFVSTSLQGLSPLNIWWLQLGIVTNAFHRPARGTTGRMSACIGS